MWQNKAEGGRDPQRKFFCDLCQKGYARMTDLENHENDYDHQHRKREKDRKQLSKDPNAEAKARAAERRANANTGFKSLSVAPLKVNLGGGAVKKAPVFRPIGQTQAVPAKNLMVEGALNPLDASTATKDNDPSGAVRNGWYSDRYDPMIVTGCESSCPACQGKDDKICL